MISFHPVIKLPQEYQVLDLSGESFIQSTSDYTIGKYNEERPYMYQQSLFNVDIDAPRFIHMGIDIGAPTHSPVHTYDDGHLVDQGHLCAAGDYGYCMVLEYIWRKTTPLRGRTFQLRQGQIYWVLYGHLSACSIQLHSIGTHLKAGTVIAYLGDEQDNGGWPPHLHIQLSFKKPKACDLPGVVSRADRLEALDLYPDPRQVLGPLYHH